MGITRRRHHHGKENHPSKLNRESRPWDNQASHPYPTTPIRPPPPPPPSAERFTPLLRTKHKKQPPASDAAPTKTSVSPRRKADMLSTSTPFAPVHPAAFQEATGKRERPVMPSPERSGHKGLSVSERMRIFENLDESVRQRTPPHVLRRSPFRSALEAFGGAVEDDEVSVKSEESLEIKRVSRAPTVLKTRLGNREVTPLLTKPMPPPLVGLPIPQGVKKRLSQRVEQAVGAMKENVERTSTSAMKENVEEASVKTLRKSGDLGKSGDLVGGEKKHDIHVDGQGRIQSGAASSELTTSSEGVSASDDAGQDAALDLPSLPKVEEQPPPTAENKMTMTDPELMPRFSYRHSVRMSQSGGSEAQSGRESNPRSSFRHSARPGSEVSSLLPKSSSFLHFDEDERLLALGGDSRGGEESESTSKAPSAWTETTFDDPDSFDTFATLPKDLQPGTELKAFVAGQEGSTTVPRPGTEESEKPSFPQMSFNKHSKSRRQIEEDDDGNLDVPNRFTRRPGAEGALRDLQRASITAGNEIAASLRLLSDGHKTQEQDTRKDKVSRVHGDVLLRSRIFRRWNLRYASIVQQGYFGAVLLLFRSDSRGGPGGAIALKSSKMIALTDSTVRKVDGGRKGSSMFMFELKTCQRTYMFACNDEAGRDFWLDNLSSSNSRES